MATPPVALAAKVCWECHGPQHLLVITPLSFCMYFSLFIHGFDGLSLLIRKVHNLIKFLDLRKKFRTLIATIVSRKKEDRRKAKIFSVEMLRSALNMQ